MSGLPPGVSIEEVYLVEVAYTAEAEERRPAARQEHLGRIAELMAAGRVIEAGGLLDFSRAILLVRVASAEEAIALFRDDVYVRKGVWEPRIAATPYGRVVIQGAADLDAG